LVGKTKRGKGTKIMGIADSHGLPLALRTESASPAEVKLVEKTLDERIVADVPERLIGDKAYDSDRLDQDLMKNYASAPKTVVRCAGTCVVGRANGSSLGRSTSAAWSCVMNITPRISKASSIWPQPSSF